MIFRQLDEIADRLMDAKNREEVVSLVADAFACGIRAAPYRSEVREEVSNVTVRMRECRDRKLVGL